MLQPPHAEGDHIFTQPWFFVNIKCHFNQNFFLEISVVVPGRKTINKLHTS